MDSPAVVTVRVISVSVPMIPLAVSSCLVTWVPVTSSTSIPLNAHSLILDPRIWILIRFSTAVVRITGARYSEAAVLKRW